LEYSGCGVFYSLTKANARLLAYYTAEELREYNVAVASLTPGDMLSEARLEHENISEQNWSDIRKGPGLEKAESCLYTVRAVVALATDTEIMTKTGHALSSGQLAQEYGFADLDGTQPIWYIGEGRFNDRNITVQKVKMS
jgi:NAD(P)-dependent dehydrogenase (short-subunit alcohol dehydrogenase family)